tara:strand:- start:894 stop:2333 length:1440 start_codon:yes stop_codon:yes gene_type:complete
VETSKDLFNYIDEAEKLFDEGSIKKAQKIIRDVNNQINKSKKIPNKLRHKFNAALAKSRYYDDVSSFAANPKRNELIDAIKEIVNNPLDSPKKQANHIHEIQAKWQLLDLSSRPAGREQWQKFNELTNKAWEPCKEFFDELKERKVQNANQRKKLINDINQFVEENSNNWPDARNLINFINSIFKKWKDYAPVLDKDLKPLRNAYYDAKKPISKEIERQENVVIKAKESLIAKVDLINDEENDVCIKKFNDLKKEWKLAGSAGRKNDNKLWDKFNKSADRFFSAKKEDVEKDLKILSLLKKDLKEKSKTPSELLTEGNKLIHLNKSKEMHAFIKDVKGYENSIKNQSKIEKLDSYKNLYEIFLGKEKSDGTNISKKILKSAIETKDNKFDKDKISYVTIKLEIMANLESLKKDSALRQKIQFEMLADKFNKGSNDNSAKLEILLIEFFNSLNNNEVGASEKKLWTRISKALDALSSELP